MTKEDAYSERGAAFFRSSSALVANAKAIMAHTGAKRLIAVIKADAYGHGATWAATTLAKQAAVHDFAVATVVEGEEVRSALPDDSYHIILLGVQNVALAARMANQHLEPAVGSLDWLLTARDNLVDSAATLRVHLAVDTGMGRMGAKSKAELSSMYQLVMADPHFELAGVFTHFATADDANQAYYDQQKADFLSVVQALGIDQKYWHLANSGSALLHHDEIPTETIRVGSVLYGYNPAYPAYESPIKLEPVGQFVGKIWGVHQLLAGEAVSYGATYVAKEDEWVGTVPVGYADGYRRTLSGMSVLINGQRQKILGRVTMDQVVVSLPGPVPINTDVTFIGQDGAERISVEELAEYGQTIPHEILTGIGRRIPRIDVK
ncbi:alanine racemase [Fructobacillus pseudoficulneus]|uniref:Alanine racemase n=1 Tax=Fructobacillus pseudoficulneus TaxID=220714 RepID=A0A3F3H405_9LACO|nr:alanine racemase [Fructobacillus pseudoficulneus]GAP03118.1 alanine racemase [Fructobacillus pseudoficulneus]SEH41289.1 alanine racemase [Fructobacillus pseudoficulneus]